MTEEKFWLSLWGLAASIVVVGLLSLTGYNINLNMIKAKLIADGGDPIRVTCALDGLGYSAGQAAICARLQP